MQSSTPCLTLNWRLINLFQVNFAVLHFWWVYGSGANWERHWNWENRSVTLWLWTSLFFLPLFVDDKVGWSPTYLCALMLLFILFKRRKCNRILKQIKCYPGSEQERKQCSPQNKHVEINHSFLLSLVSQCSTVESWNFCSLLPACT